MKFNPTHKQQFFQATQPAISGMQTLPQKLLAEINKTLFAFKIHFENFLRRDTVKTQKYKPMEQQEIQFSEELLNNFKIGTRTH